MGWCARGLVCPEDDVGAGDVEAAAPAATVPPELEFVFPRRRLPWRKNGQVLQVVKPLLRGYLFVIASPDQIAEFDSWLRANSIHVFCIRSGERLRPISANEALVLQRLMDETQVVGTTEVEIAAAGDTVRIVGGPLYGLDALVESWSRRNRRVIVRVVLGGEEKRVYLGAEFLEVTNCVDPAAESASQRERAVVVR